MVDEPNPLKNVRKSMKRKRAPNPIFKFLLGFWALFFCMAILICVIPSWKATALLKLWSIEGWQEDTWSHQKILEGGPEVVKILAPYMDSPIGILQTDPARLNVIQRTLIQLGDAALPGFWELVADSSIAPKIDNDMIYGLLKASKAPSLHTSIRAHVNDQNEAVRRVAVLLSCYLLDEKKRKWVFDNDPNIASILIASYWKDGECVVHAINKGGKLLQTLLLLAVQQNVQLNTDAQELESLNYLEEEHEGEIPALLQQQIDEYRKKKEDHKKYKLEVEAFNEILKENRKKLITCEGEQLAYYIYWLGLISMSELDQEFVYSHLTHKNDEVRERVVQALLRLDKKDIIADLWRVAHQDKSAMVRTMAWEALLEEPRPNFLPEIRLAIRELTKAKKDKYILPNERRVVLDKLKRHLTMLEPLASPEDIVLLDPLLNDYDLNLHKLVLKIKKSISEKNNNDGF